MVAALDAQPDVIAVQPTVGGGERESSRWQRIFHRGFFTTHVFHYPGRADVPRLSGCAMGFRKSFLLKQPFDERLHGYCFGEDWDISKRALRYGRLIGLPDAHVRHAPSVVNRYNRRKMFMTRWMNFRYFYRKLHSDLRLIDYVWYGWWIVGETIQWLRFGFGFPPYRKPPIPE